MLTLILMRHAKSNWDWAQIDDHDRPLNNRGRRSARAMGRWLNDHGYLPDQVVSSSSRRTAETVAGLGLDVPAHFTKALYHADPGTMMRVLRSAEAPSVLMLGHNPGIAGFAKSLVARPPAHPRFDDYPTCATLIVQFDRKDWSEVDWGDGDVVDFAIPREIIAPD